MGAAAIAGADRSDSPRSMAEAAPLEAALRTGHHRRCHGADAEADWRISFRQRYRRLLRVDAGASFTLARFRVDRGAGVRLAAAVGRLHHDTIRAQSRARRPPCDLFAISEDELTRGVIPGRAQREPGISRFRVRGLASPWNDKVLRLCVCIHPRLADIGGFPDRALAALAPQ